MMPGRGGKPTQRVVEPRIGAGVRPARVSLLVVGGGTGGLAVARRALAEPDIGSVLVLEKEDSVGQPQTGHNSGVVHAGLYYAPGSPKARLCTDGRQRLRSFCAERGIAYDECG